MTSRKFESEMLAKLGRFGKSVKEEDNVSGSDEIGSLVDQYRLDKAAATAANTMNIDTGGEPFTKDTQLLKDQMRDLASMTAEALEKMAKDDVEEDSDEYNNDSDYTYISDASENEKRIDEEWDNVVMQLQLLVGIVLIPLAGKFLGRRFAHKVWSIIGGWYYNRR